MIFIIVYDWDVLLKMAWIWIINTLKLGQNGHHFADNISKNISLNGNV